MLLMWILRMLPLCMSPQMTWRVSCRRAMSATATLMALAALVIWRQMISPVQRTDHHQFSRPKQHSTFTQVKLPFDLLALKF